MMNFVYNLIYVVVLGMLVLLGLLVYIFLLNFLGLGSWDRMLFQRFFFGIQELLGLGSNEESERLRVLEVMIGFYLLFFLEVFWGLGLKDSFLFFFYLLWWFLFLSVFISIVYFVFNFMFFVIKMEIK